jgi:hypothetical protein
MNTTTKTDQLSGLSGDEQAANGKRWGLANGYTGAQGGWIYNAKHKPVCQGWRDFFFNFRHRILADVNAERFKITRARTHIAPAERRQIYKLVIFGNLITGNEERTIEARDLDEAIAIKDQLLKGRPYFSLTHELDVVR